MLQLSDVKAAQRHAEARAEKDLPALTDAYCGALTDMQISAASKLQRLAVSFGRVAAGRLRPSSRPIRSAADWYAPTPEEVYDLLLAQARIAEQTRSARAALYSGQRSAWGPLGLSLDAANRLLEGVYPTLGQKITRIGESQRAAIMTMVDQAWQDGLSIKQASDLIRSEALAMSRTRAETIARTEIIGAQNGASLAAVRATGVASYKTWLNSGDSRVRPDHEDAEGQTVPVDQPFSVGVGQLMHPGDPSGPPEEVINCRCTMTYGDDEP